MVSKFLLMKVGEVSKVREEGVNGVDGTEQDWSGLYWSELECSGVVGG